MLVLLCSVSYPVITGKLIKNKFIFGLIFSSQKKSGISHYENPFLLRLQKKSGTSQLENLFFLRLQKKWQSFMFLF